MHYDLDALLGETIILIPILSIEYILFSLLIDLKLLAWRADPLFDCGNSVRQLCLYDCINKNNEKGAGLARRRLGEWRLLLLLLDV